MLALLKREGRVDHGLHLGVRDSGCSGHSYVLEFRGAPDPDDLVFQAHGVKVFVPGDQLSFVTGSTVRWKDELMETGFDIDNPNASRHCGCGSSFDL